MTDSGTWPGRCRRRRRQYRGRASRDPRRP